MAVGSCSNRIGDGMTEDQIEIIVKQFDEIIKAVNLLNESVHDLWLFTLLLYFILAIAQGFRLYATQKSGDDK